MKNSFSSGITTLKRHPRLSKVIRSLPRIPPATPRNLWLLIASAVAVQNIAVFHASQSANTTVFALMVWGGALICMEDQLEHLTPRPVLLGLLTGTILLLWVMARTAIVLHWDGILFALAPLAGVSLSLLCFPPTSFLRFRDPLLCLMVLPGFALLMRILPEYHLNLFTASAAGFWLSILGIPTNVQGQNVLIPGGGVEVLGACNGLDMMSQVFCVALIFILAFPLRSWMSRFIVLFSAPVIGFASNTIRIALLALCTTYGGGGHGSPLFDFFHKDTGSLIFSGVAIFAFGSLYMRLLERELSPVQASFSENNKR